MYKKGLSPDLDMSKLSQVLIACATTNIGLANHFFFNENKSVDHRKSGIKFCK